MCNSSRSPFAPVNQHTTHTYLNYTHLALPQGYLNGNDLLLFVGGKAVGHCVSYSVDYKSETKHRAVKPIASAPPGSGKFKETTVTGQSISIKTEQFIYIGETEASHKEFLAVWKTGGAADLKIKARGSEDILLAGSFIIESMSETTEADQDVKSSVSFINNGAPTTLDDTKHP